MAATLTCLYGCAFLLASMAAFYSCLNGCPLRLPIQLRPLLALMAAFSLAHTASTLACLYGCVFIGFYSHAVTSLSVLIGVYDKVVAWPKTCSKHRNTLRLVEEVSTTTRHHGVH